MNLHGRVYEEFHPYMPNIIKSYNNLILLKKVEEIKLKQIKKRKMVVLHWKSRSRDIHR